MATYQELRTRSQQVRDEQNIGGNTALRVGQLLMDIVKYFNDNDEAASEYLQQHFAMVNDGTHLLNWQQSPIVILHTMGETYDDGDWSALSQGENFFRNGFIMEADGQGGGINGETPKANVLYVNLANDTLYTWNGASFDAITTGGGGSISGDDILKNAYYSNGNLVLIIETEGGDKTVTIPVTFDASNYVPTSRMVNGKALSNNITLSQSDIPGLVAALAGKISGIKTSDNTPLTPDSNGIVTLPPAGSSISPADTAPQMDGNTALVGSSAKYAREDHVHPHDSSKLSKSDVSVETQGDGTVDINVGSGANKDTYTINLNHTHENMARLIVCEESDLPSTLDMDTIYAQVDDAETPTEIQSLWIAGLEFVGGGGAADDTPKLTSPRNDVTIDFDGQSTATLVVRGKNLLSNLSLTVTGDFTVTANGSTVSTISANDANNGVTLTLTKGSNFIGGSIVISSVEIDNVSVNIDDTNLFENIAGVKFTGNQWVNTGIGVGPNTSLKLDIEFIDTFSASTPTSDGTFVSTSNLGFAFNVSTSYDDYKSIYFWIQGQSVRYNYGDSLYARGVIDYRPGYISFLGESTTTATKTTTSENLAIGYGWNKTQPLYDRQNIIVYGLKIYQDGVLSNDFIPVRKLGVVGLYDTINRVFISSKTSAELVAVE